MVEIGLLVRLARALWPLDPLHSAPDCSRILDYQTRPPAQSPSERANHEPELCAWAAVQTSPSCAPVEELSTTTYLTNPRSDGEISGEIWFILIACCWLMWLRWSQHLPFRINICSDLSSFLFFCPRCSSQKTPRLDGMNLMYSHDSEIKYVQ